MKKQTFLRSQQNIAAGGIALLFFVSSLLVLLRAPRPGMLDSGLYDLLLPQFGLARGSFYPESAFYIQPNEIFQISGVPWAGLLQLTPTPSLVYPVACVSILCRLAGQPFSVPVLALVLVALLAAALFFLTKSLYALWGGWGVLAGGLWAGVLLSGSYLPFFPSLYPQAIFLVALTAFAAACFRGWALLRGSMQGGSVWLPAAFSGLLLTTASELSIVLLPPVLVLVGVLGWRSTSRRRGHAAVLLAVGLLLVCSVRFAASNQQVFNRTGQYHSFFDGVLLTADDPAQTLADFGLDPALAQDIGKSAYLRDEDYVLSPNGPQAEELFRAISYPRILRFYLQHPTALLRLTASVLPQAGSLDTSRCVAVSDPSEPVLRADGWDLLRRFFFSRPAAFGVLSGCCWMLGLGLLLRKQFFPAALLCLSDLLGWGLLGTALIGCGTAEIGANRFFFQVVLDLRIVLLLVFLAVGISRTVRFLAYSPLSARRAPEPVFPAEIYAPLELPCPAGWETARQWFRTLWADSRRFARVSAAVLFFVMVLVLFVPRIGAYNNGDFGRMMDAMGLVYTPEDYFTPAVQYEKVIERYDYLEPYDWTRIRPGKLELTQSWLSAGMRMLYELAGVPFSTAVLAVFHLLTLALCFYPLILALHRHWGKQAALMGVVLGLFLFCGSSNLGWLNSLFGEGIAFVGLMLVLASSVYTLEHPSAAGRRRGLLLLAGASLYLACAKAQYALLAPVLLLWWAALAFCTASSLKKRVLALVSAVLFAAAMGSFALGVYTNNDSISSQDTLYSGLLNGILLYADDPVQALEELGLDPGLAADKGKHPYLPKDAYYCPPRTEKAEALIYSKVHSTDYLLWYLRHPKAFWHLLDDTAEASAQPMPDFTLYVGESNTGPHQTVNKCNLWASLRTFVTPRRFLGYVLLFGTIYLFCFAVLFRRGVPLRHKLYAGLLLVLIALGALQYPLPMVGNGHSDPVKQLYLFREVYDLVFWLLAVAAFRFGPPLWGRFRAFLHRSHTSPNRKGRHYAGA